MGGWLRGWRCAEWMVEAFKVGVGGFFGVSLGMVTTFCARNCLFGGRMACGAFYTVGGMGALPGAPCLLQVIGYG